MKSRKHRKRSFREYKMLNEALRVHYMVGFRKAIAYETALRETQMERVMGGETI